MDDKAASKMTVIEAFEILETFKQKMVDENYDALLEDGETDMRVGFEVLEALEVATYYFNTETEPGPNPDL